MTLWMAQTHHRSQRLPARVGHFSAAVYSKAAKPSSAWAGVYKEVLKVPSLRTVIVILAEAPPFWAGPRNKNLIEKVCNNYVITCGGFDTITPIWD